MPPGGCTWIGSRSRTKPAARVAAAATSDVSGSNDVEPIDTKDPTPRPSSTAHARQSRCAKTELAAVRH